MTHDQTQLLELTFQQNMEKHLLDNYSKYIQIDSTRRISCYEILVVLPVGAENSADSIMDIKALSLRNAKLS
eukprot:snap_masked-scaffold_59-processed-gene-0.21-mRNA-1 protein AED:1.00 eAED:1.00 QI:0/0/0/0/1/1/2/0/71